MTYHSPSPLWASKAVISSFAEEVASKFELAPGSSLHELVSRLGGRIDYDDSIVPSSDNPEAIVVEYDGSFFIRLPRSTSSARDRFTVAHELGHYFLHFPHISREHPKDGMIATRFVDNSSEAQQRAEWEANWFAAGFLMPEQTFRDTWAKFGIGAATIFGVSQAAAEVRANNLGLL